MNYKTLSISLLINLLSAFPAMKAENPLITIKTPAYTSYFSQQYHEPLYVIYKLYHGGGNCSRAQFRFINDHKELQTATPKDYAHSGYDEGHLANAEDFASNCLLEEMTFRFYNCVPQTPNLNRGLWKHYETLIRGRSQNDSLLIICGSVFGNKKTGSIAVPDYCWKVVQSLTSKQLCYCVWFSNSSPATVQELGLPELEQKIGYALQLKK